MSYAEAPPESQSVYRAQRYGKTVATRLQSKELISVTHSWFLDSDVDGVDQGTAFYAKFQTLIDI